MSVNLPWYSGGHSHRDVNHIVRIVYRDPVLARVGLERRRILFLVSWWHDVLPYLESE
jgi:hypothetical protein